MKKRILALTMCLTLTAASALAIDINMPAGQIAPTIKAQPNTVMQLTPSRRPQINNVQERLEARKRFEDRKAHERELMYTTLGLTAEQKNKAEAIDAKTRAEAGKYIRRIQVEAKRLRELTIKKASWFDIHRQKQALNAARKDADKYFENSKKSFEALLTKEQLAKFRVIDNAKKKEMKEFKKHHKPGGFEHYGPKPPIGPNGFDKSRPQPTTGELKGLYGPAPVSPPANEKK